MKRYLPHLFGALFVLLIMAIWAICAQVLKSPSEPSASLLTEPVVWPLWPDGAPSSSGLDGQEELEWGTRLVTEPTLTIYPAAQPNGIVVLDCPGGGYWVVCHKHEGSDMAEWFNEQGITLAVLRYRMPNQHHTIPLEDGERAIELLREHADELGLKTIGVMGFSAGGHLASTMATHLCAGEGAEALEPDFQILVYPVISMDATITHMGSREALLGMEPDSALVALYSNELQVTPQTPPAFIVLSGNDDLVPIENSLRYYQALQTAGVPAELHMYPTDGHGWGFNPTSFHDLWTDRLRLWLQSFAH